MKIDSLKPFVNKDAQAADSRREKPAADASGEPRAGETGRGDVVRLSDRARLIASAQELAGQAPEVREDRVNDLRERINAGTYSVSGKVVAESMLKKSITEV